MVSIWGLGGDWRHLNRDGREAVETERGDARKGEHDVWALMLRVEGKDGVQCFGAAYRPESKREKMWLIWEVQGHQQGSEKVTQERKVSNKGQLLSQLPQWGSEA